MPNTPRVQDNERIERSDYEFATDEVPQAYHRAVGGNFLTNPAGMKLWIVSGFNMTNPSAKQLRTDRGVAILNAREEGQVVSGMLAFEGDTQKTVDLNAYANGTYGIWVRFELIDGEFQNRIFWNPTGLNEFTQSMATRRVASWGVRVEPVLSNPGSDWFKIGEVVVSASPSLAITKQRKFYFEGDEFSSYQATISDGTTYRTWGFGANDRNADRATYGVRDFQTMLAAIRSQIAAMQGSNPVTGWYGTVVEGLNRKVSRFGDSTMTGNYLPASTGWQLGSATYRWDCFFRDIGGTTITINPSATLILDPATLDLTPSSFNATWVAGYITSPSYAAAATVFGGGLSSWVDGIGKANNLTKAALQLLNDSDTVGTDTASAVVPITFRLGNTSAQRDGFDLFAWRAADDDPRLSIRGVADAALDAGVAILELHREGGRVRSQWDPSGDYDANLGQPTRRWQDIYGINVYARTTFSYSTSTAPGAAGEVIRTTQRNAIVARGSVNISGSGPPMMNLAAQHWNVNTITNLTDPGSFTINFDHPVHEDSTIIVTPYRPGVSAVDTVVNAYINAGGASAIVHVKIASTDAAVNRGFHFVVIGSPLVDVSY